MSSEVSKVLDFVVFIISSQWQHSGASELYIKRRIKSQCADTCWMCPEVSEVFGLDCCCHCFNTVATVVGKAFGWLMISQSLSVNGVCAVWPLVPMSAKALRKHSLRGSIVCYNNRRREAAGPAWPWTLLQRADTDLLQTGLSLTDVVLWSLLATERGWKLRLIRETLGAAFARLLWVTVSFCRSMWGALGPRTANLTHLQTSGLDKV